MDDLVCTNCGARSPRRDARFCGFCGHELPRPEPVVAPPDPADPRAGFAELRAHPEFAGLLEHVPPLPGGRIGMIALVLFLVAFLSIGGMLLLGAAMFPPMMIPVLAMVGFGVFVVVGGLKGEREHRRGALTRTPARVVDERTEVLFGDWPTDNTRYYVTLESERGGRVEYEIDPGVASQVAPGDVGVAYFRGMELVEFRRPGA